MRECRECGVEMQPCLAIFMNTIGLPDFIAGEVVMLSSGGQAKLVKCLMCPRCGYSVTL